LFHGLDAILYHQGLPSATTKPAILQAICTVAFDGMVCPSHEMRNEVVEELIAEREKKAPRAGVCASERWQPQRETEQNEQQMRATEAK
jgi:hypothetical protein